MVVQEVTIMPKIQACRNGCNTQIYVKEDDDGKFRRPFESDGKMHDCPKSPYNQKKLQGDAYRTPKPNAISDIEARILEKLDIIERKIDAVYSGRAFQDEQDEDEDLEQVA